MADVKASDVSVRIRDFLGNTAAATAYADFADGDTFGVAQTALQTWITALDKVTSGVIEQVSYRKAITLPGGLKSAAGAGIRVGAAGQFNFTNNQDQAAYAFTIPALDPAVIVAGGPDMVEGHTIDLLVDIMEAPLAGTTGGQFTTSRDGSLVLAFNGRLVDHTHRKQLNTKSSRPGI